ncbi:hypothetical protein [Pelagibius sp. Alg239-R121]|uniref:hypothetical protein n=1 Tax=Pelagibius sp. Alg239-R121 TaxID=2993448 RepID=UPI0024A61FE2|nr:hypothetical protein [Pelagibius sp. Alg239-R121]
MIANSVKSLSRHILLLAIACMATFTTGAQANIVGVTTAPGSAQVAVPNGSAVTFTWQVRRANTTRSPIQTITSNAGTLEIGGTVVATISTVLSQINNTPANLATTEIISETLVVPRNVAFQMARNADLTVIYRRTFDDGSGFTSSGSIRLVPSTGSSVPLGIRRLDLFFEDQSRVKVLPSGAGLAALADLNFDGSGTAQFEWQIAEPSSTRGALVFRRLQVFRRSLAGRGRVTLKSPPLPTTSQGLYIVRLIATDPEFNFSPPELKYFVVPRSEATTAPAGQRVVLSGPAEGALLTGKTEFSWQRTPGAAVYQLEIYPVRPDAPVSPGKVQSIGGELLIDPDELAKQPITGIVLPSDENKTSLQRYSLARLDPGRTYLWRVKAIAGNGAVIGLSPLRQISIDR